MPHDEIQIRETRLDDGLDELRTVRKILAEGAELMMELGETRWETDQLDLAQLESLARAHELFVVLVHGQIVGTFKVQHEDPLFWPDMSAGEAVYLHKIAVTKAMRGRGLTQEIVRWAKSYAAQRKRKYLRLDTDRARPGLCRLYAGLGFSFHSYLKLDWIEAARFQLAV